MEARSLRPRPVVDTLLLRAAEFAARGEVTHADSFFAAAVAADDSPVAELAWTAQLLELGELSEALSHATRGWEIAKAQQNVAGRAWACQLLATLAREQGDTVQAQQFQQLAIAAELELISSDLDQELSVESRLGCSTDWAEQGELTDARALLQSCMHDAVTTDVATAQMNLGVLSLRDGDLATALRWLEQSYAQFRELEDLTGMSRSLEALGHALRAAGRWHEAREALYLSNRIAHELGQRHRARRVAPAIRELDRALALLQQDPSLN